MKEIIRDKISTKCILKYAYCKMGITYKGKSMQIH